MAQVTDDFLRTLRSVRGEFENTKGGKIGNRILAHIFLTLFPVFFFGFFIFWAKPGWPFSNDKWLLLAGAIASIVVGVFIHRAINSRYVFNEEGVEEWRGSGTLKRSIAWSDLNHVDYRESRGIKSFTLKSNKASMHLEFYKGLSEALARIENNEN